MRAPAKLFVSLRAGEVCAVWGRVWDEELACVWLWMCVVLALFSLLALRFHETDRDACRDLEARLFTGVVVGTRACMEIRDVSNAVKLRNRAATICTYVSPQQRLDDLFSGQCLQNFSFRLNIPFNRDLEHVLDNIYHPSATVPNANPTVDAGILTFPSILKHKPRIRLLKRVQVPRRANLMEVRQRPTHLHLVRQVAFLRDVLGDRVQRWLVGHGVSVHWGHEFVGIFERICKDWIRLTAVLASGRGGISMVAVSTVAATVTLAPERVPS